MFVAAMVVIVFVRFIFMIMPVIMRMTFLFVMRRFIVAMFLNATHRHILKLVITVRYHAFIREKSAFYLYVMACFCTDGDIALCPLKVGQ